MNILNDLYFSKEHTWVRIESNIGTIGITDFAQSELGEIVYADVHPYLEPTQKQFAAVTQQGTHFRSVHVSTWIFQTIHRRQTSRRAPAARDAVRCPRTAWFR